MNHMCFQRVRGCGKSMAYLVRGKRATQAECFSDIPQTCSLVLDMKMVR